MRTVSVNAGQSERNGTRMHERTHERTKERTHHHVTYIYQNEKLIIRLFANDVIIIGLVRADWPAPFSVTIGNPRADKLGRNGFECIVLRCSVDRERCVLTTFMHSAIENYSMLHLQRWMECRGIKRSGTKSLFMIISHNCQSCLCRQQ